MARIGRRRRVLNEEVLAAGNNAHNEAALIPGDTPRYGAGANIENHPQVTDLVPRRFRIIALSVSLALGVGIVAEFAAINATRISEAIPAISSDEIIEAFASRSVAWASAAMLLLCVAYTRLIFSLRKHRVDDYRGRYRVWRTAGWAAFAASFLTVTGTHSLLGRALGQISDVNMLAGNSGWWLVPSVLFAGWLLTKLTMDVAECRAAFLAYLLGIACFSVAAASIAGFSPTAISAWSETLIRTLPLCGNTCLFAGSLLFARYIVLDVQGLIEHPEVVETPRVAEVTTAEYQPETDYETSAAEEEEDVVESAWVDGTEPEFDERNLSKSERKRLRKQKNRKRAA